MAGNRQKYDRNMIEIAEKSKSVKTFDSILDFTLLFFLFWVPAGLFFWLTFSIFENIIKAKYSIIENKKRNISVYRQDLTGAICMAAKMCS